MSADQPHRHLSAALQPPPTAGRDTSLFFDFDGTLVDLAPTPDAVMVSDRLTDRLARLAAAFPGRVGIVSGRSLDQIDALLGMATVAFAVAGSHGAERRLPTGQLVGMDRPAGLAAVDAAFAAFADEHGLVFERKSLGAALHYRMAPSLAAAADRLGRDLADVHGLVFQPGKMMVELRAPGDKGRAIDALLATPAMAGTRPLFFGDDVTDEDGFRAAAAAGGAGVLIGEPRTSAALYGLPGVAALGEWIDTVLETA